MARLRRFLMLERARSGDGEPGAPTVSARFEALSPPPETGASAAPDPFAPPPDPVIALEVDLPERGEPRRDHALAAEIQAMSIEREQVGIAPEEARYPRQIDRLAALIAVGPLARWSPRARAAVVVGLGAALIAGLFFFGGIGPRVLQVALALLLFALFIRS